MRAQTPASQLCITKEDCRTLFLQKNHHILEFDAVELSRLLEVVAVAFKPHAISRARIDSAKLKFDSDIRRVCLTEQVDEPGVQVGSIELPRRNGGSSSSPR